MTLPPGETEDSRNSDFRDLPEQFLVAFSFAGEQRQLVESIAVAVEHRLGRGTVFYDKWFEHYVAGSSADTKLQEIYGKRAELVVVGVSSQYGVKPWTLTEYDAVRALSMQLRASPNKQDADRILPLRVGDGDVAGVLFNTIAPDIRNYSVEYTVELILKRLELIRPDLELEGAEVAITHTSVNIDFSVKAKGKINKLGSDTKSRIDKLSDSCRQRIDDRFHEDFQSRKNTTYDFVGWLIHECPVTKAVSRLNGIAGDANTSANDRAILGQIGSRLIPLRYAPDLIQGIRQQLSSNNFEIVTGNIGNSSIAEVILAGFDAQPINFEKGGAMGVTAFEFLECGDYGPGQTDAAVAAFFNDILNAWDQRFGDSFLQSSGDKIGDLARKLRARVKVMEDEHDRTVYCLANLPADQSKRRELESVLRAAATHVPNLVFLEIDGRFNEEDDEFLYCITRMPKS